MRLRLTLWFVFGVVVIVIAGAVGIYVVLSQQLRGDLDSRLTQQISLYQQSISAATGEKSVVSLTQEYLAGVAADSLRRAGFTLSLQTRSGSVVSNSDDVRPEDLSASKELLGSGTRFLADAQLGGRSYRVAGTPVILQGQQVGAVQIAGSLAEIRDTLSRLLLLLAVGGTLGCVAVGLGSWFLLGGALDPVRRITRTAAAISREDLARRIDYAGPNDEIGELAQTMDAMLDRLQVAFRAQEQFLSDVSHELRTPLTIVKGHLQVLDRQNDPSPVLVKQEHALVIDELDRMNRLIADLLTLTRASRTDFLRREEVDIDLFLGSLADQGPHLGDRRWEIDSLPGGSVAADQDRLTQIFLNLMQNAVAHSSTGEVVALGGSRSSSGGTITLWVRDEGEGMDSEVCRHIFERFYRGGGDAAGGRVGLGLAIVRALVEAHGGGVTAESTRGRGSKFIVTLPA
ncbi:MAG: HAMP domain-containing sensor histidine kinase [bacterium]